MSRFSKAAAEKRGWKIVHQQDERESLVGGGQQGLRQTHPASYRAEKYVTTPLGNETLINEEADTMGKLLERIAAYEAHRDSIEDTSAPDEADASNVYPYGDISELKLAKNPKVATDKNQRDPADNEPNHESGEPFRESVQTPEGNFNEHEWFGRRTEEAVEAHEAFLKRQRDFELAKPIEPTATKGERNEEVTPQNFGPPQPEIEILLATGPGPERTEKTKKVTAKSEPSDKEEAARKQKPKTPKSKPSELEATNVGFKGSDSPPEDEATQLVEAPEDSPAGETEQRGKGHAVLAEDKKDTTGLSKAERKKAVKAVEDADETVK